MNGRGSNKKKLEINREKISQEKFALNDRESLG